MLVMKLTLDELADRTGFEKRTIRSYIQQGLLRGPEAMGRGAYYTLDHLKRLQAIRYWRANESRSMEQIRALLASVDRNELDQAAMLGASIGSNALTTTSPTAESAAEYLKRIASERGIEARLMKRSRAERSDPGAPIDPIGQSQETLFKKERRDDDPVRPWTIPKKYPGSQPEGTTETALDRLLLNLEQLMSGRDVPRRARSKGWVVIEITRDIELHVRGVFDAESLARLERLADYLREAMLGGIKP